MNLATPITPLPGLDARVVSHENMGTAWDVVNRDTPTCITIPGLRSEDLLAAKDGLLRFDEGVALEDQAAWAFHVPRDPEFDEPDDGIIRKNGHDKKVFFHFRDDLDLLLDRAGINASPAQQEWFAACRRIRNACTDHLQSIAQAMDIVQPGFGFESRVRESIGDCVLRVLKYVPRAGVIAKTHTDRCAITFHLAESARGLYAYQRFERKTYQTPCAPQAWCFSGQQLERITCGAVSALYHGVENTAPDQERWAIVFFGKMQP